MPKYKIARIASDIQRYLGEILINEVNDEILKSITITGCDVTNDLSYCKIYFTSIMNMDEKSLEKEVIVAFAFVVMILLVVLIVTMFLALQKLVILFL